MGQCTRENFKRPPLLGDATLHPAVLDRDLNHVHQRLWIDVRLANIVLGAFLHGGNGYLLVAQTGQHHHRNEGVPGANAFENFHSVAAGERIVEEHASECLVIDTRQSILATGGFAYSVAQPGAFFQTPAIKQPIVFAVVDHQNLR